MSAQCRLYSTQALLSVRPILISMLVLASTLPSTPFYNKVSRACVKSHGVSQSAEDVVLRAFPLSAPCRYSTLVYSSLFTLYRICTLNWAEQSRRRLRYTINWVTRFYPISPPRALPKLYKASTQPLLCSILKWRVAE